MEKSFNDISRQLERVITLASQIGGHYTATATGRVDIQRLAQIAAKARAQHGISLFCTNKDEKRPFIYKSEPKAETPKAQEPKLKPTELHQVEPVQPGASKPRRELTAEEDAACRKKLQEVCRHDFVRRMFVELLADLSICQLEGWDIYEFPRMIRREVERCLPKPIQLTLF